MSDINEDTSAVKTPNLADVIAQRFLSRRDAKAIQYSNGSYAPHRLNGKDIPWSRANLEAHLAGTETFGHYLINTDIHNTVKLFAFDIDLQKTGVYPDKWDTDPLSDTPDIHSPIQFNPREAWLVRSHPARSFLKLQMKLIAHELLNSIITNLNIPCAAAYSGNKGIHVYGFTGALSAETARDGAGIILDSLNHYSPTKGSNFFVDNNDDLFRGFKNFTIEVFPKQDSVSVESYGNLMRLPLGVNQHNSKDPTFFIDMTCPLGVLKPVDPFHALAGQPFKMVGE